MTHEPCNCDCAAVRAQSEAYADNCSEQRYEIGRLRSILRRLRDASGLDPECEVMVHANQVLGVYR